MMAYPHRILPWGGAFLLLTVTALAAWLAQPLLLAIPIIIVGVVLLLQYPTAVFYLLLATIPWSVEYNFPSGLGTDLPDEPLMLLASFSALALTIYHRKKLLTSKNIHPLLLLLLLQVAWLVVTVLLSTHFILSAKYFLAKSWYLLAFVALPVLLWRDEKVLKRSALVLLVSMLLVTAISLFRHAALGFHFSTINQAVSPFFRNHVNYSALLVFMIPVQVACLQLAKKRSIRTLVLFSFLITLPALYFAFARGAWLALLTGTAAYWLLRRGWLFKSFLLVVGLVTATVLWLRSDERYLQFAHDYQTTIYHEDFREHLAATYQLKDLSTAERFYRWIAGVRMVEDSWQKGFGPTTFYQHYKSYTVPAFKTWVSRNEEQSTVHNYYLLLLIEQGAMGLLLFLALLALAFRSAQRIYHHTTIPFCRRTVAAIAVILVMQCTLNFLSDLIETDKVGSIFYLCIAVLVVADRKTKELATKQERTRSL